MRLTSQLQSAFVPRVHLDTATIWSAPAERSGDGALAPRACLATLKAVSPESFRGCHRTPYFPHTTNWVVMARCTLVLIAATVLADSICAQTTNSTAASSARYEIREEHDRDGIGKFYMGREIAQVMGHQAADWLERPEREAEGKPDLLLQALKLKSGNVVADIGAGTGYYSWRMAKGVGEKGVVYAVDIQQEMLDLLAKKMAAKNCQR